MAQLKDGFSTTVDFANNPTARLYWEKEVTPIGFSAGGAIDTTTMQNTTWRTFEPKSLITATEMTFTAAYDPDLYNDIIAQIRDKQQITVTLPDGTTIVFWGWLDEFKPNPLKEGEHPTAEVKIIPSNTNASGVETAPVIT